ncbi:MAG: NADH-quinone oxidoreductase subunit C [Desulfobacteraceae bacterium Eth-SRB2]|nr:MAG: NADH-quinone oxidoreductase subunit C [Desulfobacteraceae bacterium Eth-SRB2]
MMGTYEDFKTNVMNLGGDVTETDFHQRGYHLEVVLTVDTVRKFAQTAYDHGFYLVFVTGIHVLPETVEGVKTSGLEMVYQFATFDRLCRVKARVSVPEDMTVPSICHIYQGANWHERETRDFYGIRFSDHPNLEPLLLCEEDKDFHPLLKEEKKLKSFEEVSWPAQRPDMVDIQTETSSDL